MGKILFFIFFIIKIFTINSKEEKDIFEVNKNLRFCGADSDIRINQYISRANQLKKRTIRRLSDIVYRPIRIYLETTYFEEQGKLDINLKDNVPLLKSALNKAVDGIKGLLEVEDIGGKNLYSNVDMYQIFSDNGIYKWNPIFDTTKNIQADLLILVKFDYTLPNGILASGIPLYPDSETNRPIISLISIGVDKSFYNKDKVYEYFSEVFLHELTHALGFLYTMFPYYPGGEDGTFASKPIRGVYRKVIITPTVMKVAKKYFNCSTIQGVELEDQGGTGSAESHWEQRILLGEYMGAIIYLEEMAVSEFTLALLEDSGWYKANYYTGGLLRFGKNKGCKFLDNSCMETQTYTTEFGNEFFDYNNMMAPSCSTGRLSRAYSTLYIYDYISEEKYKDYFIPYGTYYYSGSLFTADYCFVHGPYSKEGSSEYKDYFTGNCKYGNGNYGENIYYYNEDSKEYENITNSMLPKELGETYSNNSFCVMSSLVPNGKYKKFGSIFHPMCYQMYCSSSYLTIQINNDYIVCPRQGGNVKVNGYDGKMHCPDYNLICTGTVLCNNMFDCIEKKSLAKEDTYYYDYTALTTQQFSQLPDIETFVSYELSNDGACPMYCSQCSANKKCKKCLDGYNYIGVKENDDQPVICDNTITNFEKGYYKALDNVYYLCHKNCETCSIGPISDDEMNCDTCKNGFKYDEINKNCKKKGNVFLAVFLTIIIILLLVAIGIVVFIIYKKKKAVDDNTSNLEMVSKA